MLHEIGRVLKSRKTWATIGVLAVSAGFAHKYGGDTYSAADKSSDLVACASTVPQFFADSGVPVNGAAGDNLPGDTTADIEALRQKDTKATSTLIRLLGELPSRSVTISAPKVPDRSITAVLNTDGDGTQKVDIIANGGAVTQWTTRGQEWLSKRHVGLLGYVLDVPKVALQTADTFTARAGEVIPAQYAACRVNADPNYPNRETELGPILSDLVSTAANQALDTPPGIG